MLPSIISINYTWETLNHSYFWHMFRIAISVTLGVYITLKVLYKWASPTYQNNAESLWELGPEKASLMTYSPHFLSQISNMFTASCLHLQWTFHRKHSKCSMWAPVCLIVAICTPTKEMHVSHCLERIMSIYNKYLPQPDLILKNDIAILFK